MQKHLRIGFIVVVSIVLLAACAGDGDDADPTNEPAEAETILSDASAALADTESLRFNLEIDGTTYIDDEETIRLLAARGDLVRPDRVDVEFQVELLGTQTVSIRMISIGERSWTTNLLSGAWEPSPEEFGYNPTVLFDNQDGLGPVTGRLEDPKVLGVETIGGRETWEIEGSVDNDTISPLTAGTADGEVITVTLWVDRETNNVLRLQLAEPEDSGKDDPATWTMTLTGHDQELTVEPPDVAD